MRVAVPVKPTSFRFDHDTLALFDAWKLYLASVRHQRVHRHAVIIWALKQLTPPEDDTPEAKEVRRAYVKLFGRSQ